LYVPDGTTTRIAGIVDHLKGAQSVTDSPELVAIAPMLPYVFPGNPTYYLIRTAPGARDRIMRTVADHLAASNADRVVDWVRPLSYFATRAAAADTALATFLGTVTALLLAVASLGVFGLATFNVARRTKQIGIRRALGAWRRDIVQYFMVENGLITSAGILGGCVLALGVGYELSLKSHLPRLDLYYLVGGVLGLWAIGQLAVWQPARRAAAVLPAVATRTV
jgi:putative ABC transport system permease protein